MEIHELLIPTDFSDTARNATDYALAFFAGTPCTIHFLNTYTPDFVNSRVMAVTYNANYGEDRMERSSREGLEQLVDTLSRQSHGQGFQYTTTSSFNLLTEEIRQQVSLRGIDMIVSGTSGASGLKEVFLGSNTVRMLRVANQTPVLVVPREARFRGIPKIGFVTDFNRPYTVRQLEWLHATVTRFEAGLEVMHIGRPDTQTELQSFHRKQLLLELDALDPHLCWLPPEAGKAQLIERYIRDSGIKLLVMVRNERSTLEELLREPVVKRVAFHTPVPMLVLPPASL
ncbi:universal stress protein [Robiginitalea sp. M366]|uniref:universal stress protein n=1 Tax=Robiginitalea aestuariiviva TaxID=3036903 RepID=UPI00240D99D9|nr:universal stress protein [Robiginitalea aestuariiviva]MDG1571111.1 universal stress protein [Robiginitalea aestuariiviva]